MLKEWGGIIRNRQWSQFEALAKQDPSQLLADTVGELIQGFPERADRKALKKVLWLLEEGGYTPSEIDELSERKEEARPTFQAGFMISADARGDTPITYAFEEKGRVRWLTAKLNETRGVVTATEEACSVEAAVAQQERLRHAKPKPFVAAEIPPEFALSRIARAAERTKSGRPSALAYWQPILERATELEHPALLLVVPNTKVEERRAVAFALDSSLLWRLELGMASPILESLCQSQEKTPVDGDARKARDNDILAEARQAVFTPAILADHLMRLRDLAYLLHLTGEEESCGRLLSAAVELEKKGADSAYAKAVLDKTMVLLVDKLRAEARAEAPMMVRDTS